ncbi:MULTISPECIES: discoidin domain-containing protein [unclassified Sphingobacterium]|uniref:discoidin domain-containing protein n=1 Tax=unclassified Sphingobacterium TaxID=2609468 RepID=UPI0020C3D92B|nr:MULTISPECIES: discoidin domain-containing protein [unclassified Sphingobacterium]
MKKNNKSFIAICIGLLAMVSCKEDIPTYEELNDTREEAKLNVQKATDGRQDLVLFPQVDERKDQFRVNYGGVGLPAEDLRVSFAQDQKALDSVNKIREINGQELLLPFPAGSFNIDKESVVIPKGKTSSEYLTLTYNPKKFDLSKEYMLALTATNDQGYSFFPTGKTILYYAAVVEKVLPKAKWEAKADSEELTGEGESNGKVKFVIDNSINTFWHTQWQGSEPKFPHWVEVDFKEYLYVTQIGLTRRQNNTNGFKTFDILGSTDGTTWKTLAADQVMERTEIEMQKFAVPAQYLKKIKINIKDNFNNQASTHLAEIDVIGY